MMSYWQKDSCYWIWWPLNSAKIFEVCWSEGLCIILRWNTCQRKSSTCLSRYFFWRFPYNPTYKHTINTAWKCFFSSFIFGPMSPHLPRKIQLIISWKILHYTEFYSEFALRWISSTFERAGCCYKIHFYVYYHKQQNIGKFCSL